MPKAEKNVKIQNYYKKLFFIKKELLQINWESNILSEVIQVWTDIWHTFLGI